MFWIARWVTDQQKVNIFVVIIIEKRFQMSKKFILCLGEHNIGSIIKYFFDDYGSFVILESSFKTISHIKL